MRAFVLLALSLVASPALAHPNGAHTHPQPVSQQLYLDPDYGIPPRRPRVQYVNEGYQKQAPTSSVGATACIPITIGNPRHNYAP